MNNLDLTQVVNHYKGFNKTDTCAFVCKRGGFKYNNILTIISTGKSILLFFNY